MGYDDYELLSWNEKYSSNNKFGYLAVDDKLLVLISDAYFF
jgi:hypothetical protein